MKQQLTVMMGSLKFTVWMARMTVLLKQDGVVFVGAVNHHRLSLGLSQASYLLYPTKFVETGDDCVMS